MRHMSTFSSNLGRSLIPALFMSIVQLASSTTCFAASAVTGSQITSVTQQRIIQANQEPQSWLTHGRTYAEDRHSPLTQITPENVTGLGLSWYFDTQTRRGLEATPLVIDGVLYSTTSWSQVIANDARTGKLLWRYDPKVPRAWGINACCDVVNRGLAAWDNLLYLGTLDGRLIALERSTGEVVWDKLTIDPEKPYTITGAPRAVNGKIIIGNGGAEYGVRGYVSAYDARTGEQIWRFYTVPGSPELPYESAAMRKAATTWTGDVYWQVGGGGTVWDSMAYDPDLNLLYIGVGNGSPWNRWVRSPQGGDNLFLSSIVALNPDTGQYVWHYQTTPGDTWDFTATQHMILTDLIIRNKKRKVIMQAPKNGFFYVLDRQSGELLSADKYVPVTWASHVDLESGRPVESANADHSAETQNTAPAALGGHNWQPMAYNPQANLVYIPALEAVQPFSTERNFSYKGGSSWHIGQAEPIGKGASVDGVPNKLMEEVFRNLMRGKLIAWDPTTQDIRWSVEHATAWNGGILSTASNLVFQGTGDGRLVAYLATTGEQLWETYVGTGIVAPPITYSIDDTQYIAVLAGWGGVGGISLPQLTYSSGTSRLLVFKLGGAAKMPIDTTAPKLSAQPPRQTGSEASISRGEDLYLEHCMRCHGTLFGHEGAVKNLRFMSAASHEIFDQIVLGGVYSGLGMVSFADVLNESQAQDVHNYIVDAANTTWDEQNQSGWWHDFLQWLYTHIGKFIAWVMNA